eukprot:4651471-Amphidinium_carterae.1
MILQDSLCFCLVDDGDNDDADDNKDDDGDDHHYHVLLLSAMLWQEGTDKKNLNRSIHRPEYEGTQSYTEN